MAHTLLLWKNSTQDSSTGTFASYRTFEDCMDVLCKIFKEHFKKHNPANPAFPELDYDVGRIYQFVDQLPIVTCMVQNENTTTYIQYFKDSIKEKLYQHFRDTERCRLLNRKTPEPESTPWFEITPMRVPAIKTPFNPENQKSAEPPISSQGLPNEQACTLPPSVRAPNIYIPETPPLLSEESSSSEGQADPMPSAKTAIPERIGVQSMSRKRLCTGQTQSQPLVKAREESPPLFSQESIEELADQMPSSLETHISNSIEEQPVLKKHELTSSLISPRYKLLSDLFRLKARPKPWPVEDQTGIAAQTSSIPMPRGNTNNAVPALQRTNTLQATSQATASQREARPTPEDQTGNEGQTFNKGSSRLDNILTIDSQIAAWRRLMADRN